MPPKGRAEGGSDLPVTWWLDRAAALFDRQVTVEAAAAGLGFGLRCRLLLRRRLLLGFGLLRSGNRDAVAGQCRTERPDVLAFTILELSIRAIAQPVFPAANVNVIQLAVNDVIGELHEAKADRLAVGVGQALHEIVRATFGVDSQESIARIKGLLQGQVAGGFQEALAVCFACGLDRLAGLRCSYHCISSLSGSAKGRGVSSTAGPFLFPANRSPDCCSLFFGPFGFGDASQSLTVGLADWPTWV